MNDKNSNQTKILMEILKWIKFSGMKEIRELLTNVLSTNTERLMYELTDGEASTRDIAVKCNVTHVTVGNYWQKWKVMGILEATEKYNGKRYKKICSLKEIGIDVPEISVKEAKSNLSENVGDVKISEEKMEEDSENINDVK